MERFKVVERETKTKAYSKEGMYFIKLKYVLSPEHYIVKENYFQMSFRKGFCAEPNYIYFVSLKKHPRSNKHPSSNNAHLLGNIVNQVSLPNKHPPFPPSLL